MFLASLREVTLKIHETALKQNITIVPGKMVCTNCMKKINQDNVADIENYSSQEETEFEAMATVNNEKQELADSFDMIGLSPIKVHGIPDTHKKKTLVNVRFKWQLM